MLLALVVGLQPFLIIFVSLPVYTVIPTTHYVFLTLVPLSIKFL